MSHTNALLAPLCTSTPPKDFPVRASKASRNESWSVSFAFFVASLAALSCLAAAHAPVLFGASSIPDVHPADPRMESVAGPLNVRLQSSRPLAGSSTCR
jgi:hypothetical protein